MKTCIVVVRSAAGEDPTIAEQGRAAGEAAWGCGL